MPARTPGGDPDVRSPAKPLLSIRVRCVVPCFNRPTDLSALLKDMGSLELFSAYGPIDLRTIVVDNASSPPLGLPHPGTDRFLLLRLPTNTGGSGGFNAGLSAWMDLEPPHAPTERARDLLWLVDSDARLRPDTLRSLVDAILADTSITAIGPAIADPTDWKVHEIGGMIDRRDGGMKPLYQDREDCPTTTPVDCDYIAACCALVRRDAAEHVGLLPDRFLNADDAEWFIRLARATGRRVCVLPTATAAHPRFDRFPTWTRFFGTRNVLGPIDALQLGFAVRLRRVLAELGRAINMTMMDRDDLAALHLAGLREAAARRTVGAFGRPTSPIQPATPASELVHAVTLAAVTRNPGTKPLPVWVHPLISKRAFEYGWVLTELRAAELPSTVGIGTDPPPGVVIVRRAARLFASLWRTFVSPPNRVAIVPASGRPGAWLVGRTVLSVTHDSFVARSPRSFDRLMALCRVSLRGIAPVLRLALRPASPDPLPRRVTGLASFVTRHAPGSGKPVTLSVVILSYNRRDCLRKTIRHILADPTTREAEVLIVDNASCDGSAGMVRAEFPALRLLELPANIAVAGFNVGVAAARGEIVLVLDDDARPDSASLARALQTLQSDPNLAAVPLHPRHPTTGISEWPFATGPRAAALAAASRWPIMGCGNLVRRDDWLAVGGYDESFFLYRNDVDLAMKLLAAGRGITHHPDWIVWHDSPAATRKSARWFELATRNWFWLARRHARGAASWLGVLVGWGWAHRLAGFQPMMHLRILRGLFRSLRRPPPQVQPCVRGGPGPHGQAFADFLRLQIWGRRGAGITGSPMVDTPSIGTPAVRSDVVTSPANEPSLIVVPRGIASNTIASSPRHSP